MEKAQQTFHRSVTAAGIVGKLVGTDAAHIKIAGGGMRKDDAAGGGMGKHHAAVGEGDAQLPERQAARKVKNQALVGQRGVTHCRAHRRIDTFRGKCLQNLAVQEACRGFGHAVEDGLAEHGRIGIVLTTGSAGYGGRGIAARRTRPGAATRTGGGNCGCHGRSDGSGKEPDETCRKGNRKGTGRRDEIRETQAGRAAMGMLLPQKAQAHLGRVGRSGGKDNVVAVAPCRAQGECSACHSAPDLELPQKRLCLGTQGGCLRVVLTKTPGIIEVRPLDGGAESLGRILPDGVNAIGRCA